MTRIEHLLVCLAEECAEVTKEVTKILRFGLKDQKFVVNGTDHEPNDVRLQTEIIDVMAVLELLQEEDVIFPDDDKSDKWDEMMEVKKEKIEKYIVYAQEKGLVDK